MTKQEIQQYLYQECRKAGFTDEGIAALFAQIEKESRWIVNNVEDQRGWTDDEYTYAVDNGLYDKFADDQIGYGLYQLTYPPRKKMYLDFTHVRNAPIGDLENQVAFLLWELYKSFPKLWSMLRQSHDLESLVKTLLYEWENPDEKVQNYQERLGYAREFLAHLHDYDVPVSGQNGAFQPVQTSSAIDQVLNLARAEVGYHEKANNSGLDSPNGNNGSGNFTKYARDLDAIPSFYNGKKNGFAWCDMFVDWLFVKCFGAEIAMQMLCQPKNSAGAGCSYSRDYYKAAGRFSTEPQIGAQIFFWDSSGQVNHTGIVENVSGDSVTTIEGNSSDKVQRRIYNVNDGWIAGYGIPRWELAQSSVQQSAPVPSQTNVQVNIMNNLVMLLKLGDTGSEVSMLQQRLRDLGYDIGPYGVDGEFGTDTLEALKQYQRDHNLSECGYFGPVTFESMKPQDINQSKPQRPEPVKPQRAFRVGDIVNFIGTKQYLTPITGTFSFAVGGRAKITTINANAAHPYYLMKLPNGGSNVAGWVDKNDVEAIE